MVLFFISTKWKNKVCSIFFVIFFYWNILSDWFHVFITDGAHTWRSQSLHKTHFSILVKWKKNTMEIMEFWSNSGIYCSDVTASSSFKSENKLPFTDSVKDIIWTFFLSYMHMMHGLGFDFLFVHWITIKMYWSHFMVLYLRHGADNNPEGSPIATDLLCNTVPAHAP